MIDAFRCGSVEEDAMITPLKNNEIIVFIYNQYCITPKEYIPKKLIELLLQVKERLKELDEVKHRKLIAKKVKTRKHPSGTNQL